MTTMDQRVPRLLERMIMNIVTPTATGMYTVRAVEVMVVRHRRKR